jgi:hypothetical protein
MDLVKNYVKDQWDRVGAWVCVIAGAVALLLGYLGVSGTPYIAEQIPYIVSGGLLGLFLLGLGAMLWLSADLRDEWRKIDAVDRHLMATGSLPSAEEISGDEGDAEEVRNGVQPPGPREVVLR